ncbi:hypothetical protein ACYZFV_11410 [Serratia ureilytica]|uniref:hypothetical protein n=1 Tax=Serratia marcescens TaxID=615 RepID=UPI0018C2BF39|nr:hypothetical protein [Serratia marcescens]MBN5390775.1 hypothetical protein [Serratia marcescens]QPJ91264.1 hypothetical protein HS042_24445 [Serratia marcescens]
MTMPDLPSSIAEETMEIAGMRVKVHVLDNGQRVIDAADAEKLFQWLAAAPTQGNNNE